MDIFPYNDILNAEAPKLTTRKPMPVSDRASQFSPFAAVTGHEAAIEEISVQTEPRAELSEDTIAKLNSKLKNILENIKDKPKVKVKYFVPDDIKSVGIYLEKEGNVIAVDTNEFTLEFEDGTIIEFHNIMELYCN